MLNQREAAMLQATAVFLEVLLNVSGATEGLRLVSDCFVALSRLTEEFNPLRNCSAAAF